MLRVTSYKEWTASHMTMTTGKLLLCGLVSFAFFILFLIFHSLRVLVLLSSPARRLSPLHTIDDFLSQIVCALHLALPLLLFLSLFLRPFACQCMSFSPSLYLAVRASVFRHVFAYCRLSLSLLSCLVDQHTQLASASRNTLPFNRPLHMQTERWERKKSQKNADSKTYGLSVLFFTPHLSFTFA